LWYFGMNRILSCNKTGENKFLWKTKHHNYLANRFERKPTRRTQSLTETEVARPWHPTASTDFCTMSVVSHGVKDSYSGYCSQVDTKVAWPRCSQNVPTWTILEPFLGPSVVYFYNRINNNRYICLIVRLIIHIKLLHNYHVFTVGNKSICLDTS